MTGAIELGGESGDSGPMALITCSDCGSQVSDRAAACPKCGGPIGSNAQPAAAHPEKVSSGAGKIFLVIAVAVLAIFFAFGFAISSSPEGEQRSKDRAAIDYCWQEQRRASLAPDEARFIAGACEKMEDDFRAKHGRSP